MHSSICIHIDIHSPLTTVMLSDRLIDDVHDGATVLPGVLLGMACTHQWLAPAMGTGTGHVLASPSPPGNALCAISCAPRSPVQDRDHHRQEWRSSEKHLLRIGGPLHLVPFGYRSHGDLGIPTSHRHGHAHDGIAPHILFGKTRFHRPPG